MQKVETAIKLAEECLNCKNPICSKQGCPIGTSIPEFISKIKEADFEQAYYILQENNIMSNICSLICPSEIQCMGKCVKGIRSQPVKINELEAFVNKWAEEKGVEYTIKCKEKNNIKVAVIGGGPAGIACSVELAKKGFSVTIFEKESELGGVLRYGIPYFRLSKVLVDNLINKVKKLNIEIKTGMEFGIDVAEKELRNEGYEAIFLGLGASKSSVYKLSDKEDNWVHKADEFLKKYNNGKSKELGELGTVVIIGGGNVAMDAARASIRMGADKVYVIYRRDLEAMPAREIEREDAIKDGVEIFYLTKIIGCVHEDEKTKEIICIKTRMEDGKPIDIENSEFKMKVNNIVFAIGIFPDKELLESLGLKFDRDLLEVDENQMTNIPGIFAGGDLIESKSSVCRAIKMGKTAAIAIERYIMNDNN